MIIGCLFDRYNCFVATWSSWVKFLFHILAVWYFRLEHSILTCWVEKFLTLFIEVIDTRSWVLRPSLIVMFHIMLFPELSCHLWLREIINWCLRMDSWHFWVVSSWTNKVKTSCSVSCRCQLLNWNTWSLSMWNDSQILMLILLVLEKGLVKILLRLPIR